jgi:opacity protein-like surface antigen
LLAGRITVDLTEKTDVGVMASTLRQSSVSANQYAYGVEGGYQVKKNMWVSIGYNWSDFYDRDLSSSDYTEAGFYLRLRAKFDELSF